jgi:hypothetical protein
MPAASGVNSEAGGVWTLRDAERFKRAGTWPSSFSPLIISGLQCWFDASDATTLFDATSGGSLVAAGGAVARWQDKSGNGRHATQATSANRAVRQANAANGLDGIYFNGTSATNFETSISGFRNYTSLTVFCVIKPVAAAQSDVTSFVGFRYSVAGYPPTGNDELALGFATGAIDGETICFFGPPGAGRLGSSSYSRAANTTSVFALRTGASGTSLRANASNVSVDLASEITTQSNISPASATSKTTDVFYLGSTATTPAQTYCELLIYSSALSDADRSAVESYLISKWGIA